MKKKTVTVGVSLDIPNEPGNNIWSNGGRQNAIFLYLLLKQIPRIDRVFLLIERDYEGFIPEQLASDIREDIHLIGDVIDQVDVLIEMSAYVHRPHKETVRNRGGKIVTYKFGNDYAIAVENLSLGAHKGWVCHPSKYPSDEVWTNEQHVNTCLTFFKHLYKSEVRVVPHIWAPILLEESMRNNPETAQGWPYAPRPEKTRISIFEPNINVLKNFLIPFYAAATFYEQNPDKVSNIYLLNCLKLMDNPFFTRIVSDTVAGADGVASAEKRHPFVDFMGKYGGIVLTHQWENGLNYLYYEALYGGFPLVHNSPFMKDLGYYYSEFDIDDAARALGRAVDEHDKNLEAYKEKSMNFLATLSPFSDQVIAAYDELIDNLLAK